jgi:hypothetical protein
VPDRLAAPTLSDSSLLPIRFFEADMRTAQQSEKLGDPRELRLTADRPATCAPLPGRKVIDESQRRDKGPLSHHLRSRSKADRLGRYPKMQLLYRAGHKPATEMPSERTRVLERFSNTYVHTDSIEGGFFLRKKPLCGVVSVYSNWRTAIARIFIFLCLILLVSGARQPARAQAAADEYRIKAAFLFHFAQFIEWPDGALDARDPSLILCIFDDEPRLAEMQSTVEGKLIGSRVLRVRLLSPALELQGCNIVFLSRDQAQRQAAVLRRLRGQPMLTVGESANFLSEGGIIRFHLEENKIHFDINHGASDLSHLKISSQLLLLASAVIRGNGTGGR